MKNHIQLLLANILVVLSISTLSSQTVPPPPLPDVKNPAPVNPVTTKPVQPVAEQLKPLEENPGPAPAPTGPGFFDDALTAVKTTNSVFAEVSQIQAFKALPSEEAKKAYVQKYMTDRVGMLLRTANELAPGKLAASLTESDRQKIDSFASEMAKGTYKVQDLPAGPSFQKNLAQLLEHVKQQADQLAAGLEPDQQAESLSSEAADWLIQKNIVKPDSLSTNDKAILNDLARMVLASKATPANLEPPSKPLPIEPVSPQPNTPQQPTVNRVAQHQPALTEFLNTLPQTLLNRGGPQNYSQLRDQMLDITLRALQQQFLGGQALTDDERSHVVSLVDQALKPFENLVGRILHPHVQPTNFVSPYITQLNPTTQPVGLQPITTNPYTQLQPMPFGSGLNCPIWGMPGLRMPILPAAGLGLFPFR